jgi:hypothetical protein
MPTTHERNKKALTKSNQGKRVTLTIGISDMPPQIVSLPVGENDSVKAAVKDFIHKLVRRSKDVRMVNPRRVVARVKTELPKHQALQIQVVSTLKSEDAEVTDLLPIEQVVKQSGLTKQAIYAAEKRGELFSVIHPGRQRGRAYPSFQFKEGLYRPGLYLLIQNVNREQLSTNRLSGLLKTMMPEFANQTGIEMLQTNLLNRKGLDKSLWKQLSTMPIQQRVEHVNQVIIQFLRE